MGGAYSFVDCLSHVTLATHPFRDGAPFLFLLETSSTFGRSLRLLSHVLHKKRFGGPRRFKLSLPKFDFHSKSKRLDKIELLKKTKTLVLDVRFSLEIQATR